MPLAPYPVSASSSVMVPEFGRIGWDRDVPFRAEQSVITYSLHFDQLWFRISCDLLQVEASLMSVERCINQWL